MEMKLKQNSEEEEETPHKQGEISTDRNTASKNS